MPVIPFPLAVGEKKLQPHDEARTPPLLTVNHARKPVETALERPNIKALVGPPIIFRQDACSMETHIPGSGDLVGDEVQANQCYRHFKKRAILGSAGRTRIHAPHHRCQNRRRPADRVATIRKLYLRRQDNFNQIFPASEAQVFVGVRAPK